MATVRAVLVAMAIGLGLVVPAVAETQSEVVFQQRAWEVRIVQYDDGTVSCVAQVNHGTDSFAVWGDATQAIQLQFYSETWDFGEGTTANLEVQVDRRAPWSLSNAELYLQSVLFNIPDSDDGVRFLTEVMRGNTLALRNEQGEGVMDYSLSGSSASIGALVDCMDAIGRPANPFQ